MEPIKAWLDGFMRKLQPPQLKVQDGETLGDAFRRVIGEEEKAIQASADGDKDKKLMALSLLRRQFGDGVPEGEAVWEMVLGPVEGLKDVSLSNFGQLVQLWREIVNGLGDAVKLDEETLDRYRHVGVVVEAGDDGDLVAKFRGTKEMVHMFRDKLKELG